MAADIVGKVIPTEVGIITGLAAMDIDAVTSMVAEVGVDALEIGMVVAVEDMIVVETKAVVVDGAERNVFCFFASRN